MKVTRVAIVETHPIQYHVPWYQALSKIMNLECKVFYAMFPDSHQQGAGFDTPFQWDISLRDGYAWEVLPNQARKPSVVNFWGSNIPSIRKILTRHSYDTVIINGWNAFSLLQVLHTAIKANVPAIVRGESNSFKSRNIGIEIFHHILLRKYNAYLAIGKANKEFYLKNNVPQNLVFDSPYFVDNDRFIKAESQNRSQRSSIRADWNIPEDAICFLYAGKLIPKKRILDLIAAFSRAKQISDTKIHLLIVGNGQLFEAAKRSSVGLPITFAGFLNQSEMIKAYVSSDCIILPSDYRETWGVVINEAMACGLPAIVSDQVGCGPDLVSEGVTGHKFPCGDVERLAEIMADLVSDPDRLVQMGKNAQSHIQSYSVDRAVSGTLDAIEFVSRGRL